jgi:hypothetical protein
MGKWRKSQLQAFIDKYGPTGGPALLRLLKIHAAKVRRGIIRPGTRVNYL